MSGRFEVTTLLTREQSAQQGSGYFTKIVTFVNKRAVRAPSRVLKNPSLQQAQDWPGHEGGRIYI